MEDTETASPKRRVKPFSRNLTADEALAFFLLEGGTIWDVGEQPFDKQSFCAIEPGHIRHDSCNYAWGVTRGMAALNYYKKYKPGQRSTVDAEGNLNNGSGDV